MFYYMHNINNDWQCKMCWNEALTFGVGSIKLSFRAIVFTQYIHAMMFTFNCYYNYTFQLNDAEGLHFSAFLIIKTMAERRTTSKKRRL